MKKQTLVFTPADQADQHANATAHMDVNINGMDQKKLFASPAKACLALQHAANAECLP